LQRGVNTRSLIAAIGVDAFDEGEQCSRPRVQHWRRAAAILNIGGVDGDVQQQAVCVDEDVTLAAFDLLARVEPLRIEGFAPF
jgi:hypothetical protein